jgi:site-specific DNA-adenine methylase
MFYLQDFLFSYERKNKKNSYNTATDPYRNSYFNMTHNLKTIARKFNILILLSDKNNRRDMTAEMMI